jgi:thioredoxin
MFQISPTLFTFHRLTALQTLKLFSLYILLLQIKIVTEQELEVEVANRDCPMIIDFFATWCGPCVLLAKELEQVAEELGDKIKIIKIDCDENEAISSALQIQGLPTLIFVGMDPQKPALRTEGLLPAQAIIDIVQKELLASADA